MSETQDAEFFLRREAAARELAAASDEPQIVRIHLESAERYKEQAAALSGRSTLRPRY